MFFETTIMGKTADLAMIQKTNIDALHKEGKSQKVITERCGCSQNAVSKHIKCKVDWKEEFGLEKVHKQQGLPQAWEYSQEKLSNTWESFTRSGLKLESVHQESPRSDVFRKRATKPLLKQRQRQKHLTWLWRKRTGLLLSGPKSSFQMKVNFAFHLEIKVPESWSPVWSFNSQWWFGLLCHLLCWSTVFSEVHSQRSHLPGNFRALHASFCWQALWRCWFHFPAGLGTCPHCQRYQKLVQWPWCYCAWLASKLAWPEPHRKSMGYCQEEDERHQTHNADELKATVKETWASIPPQQCHKLITSMPRRIEAVIKAKGAPTKLLSTYT